MRIQNKTFVITGGVSGLGLATVHMIIENGGNCIIMDIDQTKGSELAEKFSNKLIFVKTDVASEDDVMNAIEIGITHFKNIDGLINCAGIGPAKRVVGKDGPHDLSFFQRVIQINLVGTFNVLRIVANNMQHNAGNENGERGVIINTASIAAFDGQIGQAAYAASKGGIVSMTLPLAREFARMGIRVMGIAPGIFETPLLMGIPFEAQDSLAKQIPFPSRFGKPEEFASLVKQIIENVMLNGEVIRIDGAIRMGPK